MSFNLCDLNFVYAKEGWVSNYCTCREWQYLLTYAIHRYVIYSRPDVNFVNGTARVGRFVCENCAQTLVVVSLGLAALFVRPRNAHRLYGVSRAKFMNEHATPFGEGRGISFTRVCNRWMERLKKLRSQVGQATAVPSAVAPWQVKRPATRRIEIQARVSARQRWWPPGERCCILPVSLGRQGSGRLVAWPCCDRRHVLYLAESRWNLRK